MLARMGPPAGYEVRAPSPVDIAAVAAVLVAADLHDAGAATLGEDFLRSKWHQAGFDLASDAWVVVDGTATVVGYGHVHPEEPGVVDSMGFVHPGHRGRGIGTLLLDRIEGRISALLTGAASPRLRHAINATDRAAAMMLQARGLRPVRHFWHMQLDLDGSVDPGPAPAGIEISIPASDDDLRAVHQIMSEAFAEHWGHHAEPFDVWAKERTGDPGHDATLWLLARENGDAVGALTSSAHGDRGWVDELGVLAACRGRGIGVALLRRSFATFAGRGVEHVLLNVDADNTTGATALYERVGMRVVNRWDMWERHG